MTLLRFEEEWNLLKQDHPHYSILYNDQTASIRKKISEHPNFQSKVKVYGVYVIRQQETREVLYIGKGGTVNPKSQLKGQDILGRLANVRDGDMAADKWLRNLVETKGPLLIEYIALEGAIPKSPAFLEAQLLQAYLNENKCLPYYNKAL